MRRREFITALGGTAAASLWSPSARAQQSALPVVGFLDIQSAKGFEVYADAFRQGLKEAGFIEGKSVVIEWRWAEGHDERLPALAADLVRRQVAVIATGILAATLAAKAATATTPIVFQNGGDPVLAGLVASMGRPGGKITGFTNITPGLTSKRVGLLHDLVPSVTRIGALVGRTATNATNRKDLEEAARTLGLEIIILEVSNDAEIEAAFPQLIRHEAGALVLADSGLFNNRREKLVGLAAQYKLPTIYTFPEFAAAGGLISYASSLADAFRQVGVYTGRILKGEKPADLPVLQPTKFDLVINLKTATALGLTVPPSLIAIADEVIE
jgi:putative tryptophan/tyrosine transport system substrate-binding protein